MATPERPRLIVIALMGAARSGKDTAAAVLADEYGFTRIALASPLKDGLAAMLGLSREELDRRKEAGDPVIRHQLQTLGTEWGRAFNGEDFWLDCAINRINRLIESHSRRIVITDCRFTNEIDGLRRHFPGTVGIKVERPGVSIASSHASEQGIPEDRADYHLGNTGSIDAFRVQVRWLADDVIRNTP